MKKKYQIIIGLLLSMTALFMLSCEDVMTGNVDNSINPIPEKNIFYGDGFTTISIPLTQIPDSSGGSARFGAGGVTITISKVDTNTVKVSVYTNTSQLVFYCSYHVRMYRDNLVQLDVSRTKITPLMSGQSWDETFYLANFTRAEAYNITIIVGGLPNSLPGPFPA